VTAAPKGTVRTGRRLAAAAGLLVPALLLATACTAGAPSSSGLPPIGAPTTAPPVPPAACLLDTDALATGTGLSWTPDATTASDTRCVYDPGPSTAASATPAPTGAPGADRGAEFVAVGLAKAGDQPAAAQLDVLAEPCTAGSRTPTRQGGFVCRFPAGSVFAGRVRADQVITIAASAVPSGTTGDALATAFAQQLDALG
jgi:hypothetical protein